MADTRLLQIAIEAKNNATKELDTVRKSLESVEKSNSNMATSVFKGVASWDLLKKGVGGFVSGISAMLQSAGAFEQTKAQFETLLGSAEKANTMIRDLQNLAIKTPYDARDLQEGSKLLLAFGASASSILPTMSMMADVAMGSKEKLHSLSLAFGQMSSTGRLMGQDLLQMINGGFNPLVEISAKTGKSMASLKKDMEAGKISVEMVTQAYKDATSEGGRFFGMSEKQSKTFLGRVTAMQEQWDIFLRTAGGGLIMFANMAVEKLNNILTWLNKDAEGFNFVGRTVFSLGNLFIALGKTVWAVAVTVGDLIAVMMQLGVIGMSMIKDLYNGFANLGKNISGVFKAVGMALKGNFEGAKDQLASLVTMNFSSTIAQFDVLGSLGNRSAQAMADAGSSWKKFATMEGFDGAKEKFGALGEDIKTNVGGGLAEAGKEADKLKEKFKTLQDKIKDVATKSADSLDEIGKKIVDVQAKMNELLVGRSQEVLGQKQEMAQAYIEQEARVAEMEKAYNEQKAEVALKANERVDGDNLVSHNQELARIQTELATKQAEFEKNKSLLEQHKTIELAYTNEVAEARRVNGLTDFERTLENLSKKQILTQQEFDDKMAKMQTELDAELLKQENIKKIQAYALKESQKFLAQGQKQTIASVNAEIEYYNKLADAIARAKAGQRSSGLSASASLNAQASSTNVAPVVTINVGTLVGKDGMKELTTMVGDNLVKDLGNNKKLTY